LFGAATLARYRPRAGKLKIKIGAPNDTLPWLIFFLVSRTGAVKAIEHEKGIPISGNVIETREHAGEFKEP